MNIIAGRLLVGPTMALTAISAVAESEPDRRRPANDPDRLICRSMPVIGSLAARRRQCFTRAEWERIARGAQKQAVDLQGTLPSGQLNQ